MRDVILAGMLIEERWSDELATRIAEAITREVVRPIEAQRDRYRAIVADMADEGCRWDESEGSTCRHRYPGRPDCWCFCCRSREALGVRSK